MQFHPSHETNRCQSGLVRFGLGLFVVIFCGYFVVVDVVVVVVVVVVVLN